MEKTERKKTRPITETERIEIQKFLFKVIPLCIGGRKHNPERNSITGAMEWVYKFKEGNLIYIDCYKGNVKKFFGQQEIYMVGEINDLAFRMNYYGKLCSRGLDRNKEGEIIHKENIINCIKTALGQEKKQTPWRGPEKLEFDTNLGLYVYDNWSTSDMESFKGNEKIIFYPKDHRTINELGSLIYDLVYEGGILEVSS